MSKRDYYEVLGVSKKATPEEIKSAHRRLVRKLHPDVNKAEDAAGQFSEVQEAYDILSVEDKRSRYDQFGHAGVNGPQQSSGAPGGGGAWSDVDPEAFESVFGDFFRGRGGAGAHAGPESGFGGFDFGGFSSGSRQQAAQPRRGRDLKHEITIGFMVAATGGTETIRLADGDGSVQSIEVKIPAGIASGATLRVRGKGNPGFAGGTSGDLRLKVRVAQHPWFRRDGLDISLEVPITIVESTLGTTVELPLLKGSVSVRVPAGTSSGARLRVSGKGIVDPKGESGDFYATILIVAPTDLSEEDRERIEQLGQSLADPRASLPWSEAGES